MRADVRISVDGSRPLAETSDRFVAFTMDWHRCELEQPGVPLRNCSWHNASVLSANLTRLLPFAKGLSPYGKTLLRIGGGPADSAVYDVGPLPRPVLFGQGPSNSSTCPGLLCLTMARWDEINAWALAAGVRIVFGLNALSADMAPGGKQLVRSGVPWDSTNVRALLEYSKQRGFVEQGSLYGFELGNEIQGPAHDPPPGHTHRGLSAPFHAAQFAELSKIIAEVWSDAAVRPRLVGPDQNPCCLEWTEVFLSSLHSHNVTLDAFTCTYKDITKSRI